MKTPCQELGYKIGDLFEIISDNAFCWKKGSLIELIEDDNSEVPGFKAVDVEWKTEELKKRFRKEKVIYVGLDYIRKLGDLS